MRVHPLSFGSDYFSENSAEKQLNPADTIEIVKRNRLCLRSTSQNSILSTGFVSFNLTPSKSKEKGNLNKTPL